MQHLRKEIIIWSVMILLLFSARASLADHYLVPSSSMEYTLMPGDRVFVDKTAYGVRVPLAGWKLSQGEAIKRGEIVIFDSPEDDRRLIKRAVAVGGDTVTVRKGHLLINGKTIAGAKDGTREQFGGRMAYLNLSLGGGPDIGPVRVPEGYVLVIGDFRGNSRDGRMFGLITEDQIYARAVAVYYRRGRGLVWERL